MSKTITERLRGMAPDMHGPYKDAMFDAAARIDKLEALVNSLDIECMHPSMDGRHQCSIRANGRALSVEQWDTIMSCRSADGAS
jgi:hypothetical protein